MIVVVHLGPRTVSVVLGLCDGLSPGGSTDRAGIGLLASFLTAGLLGHGAIVPCMGCLFHGAAVGAGALVIGIVCLGPSAVAVIALDLDGQRIDGGRDGTGGVTGVDIGGDGGIANRSAVLDLQSKGEDLAGNGGSLAVSEGAGAGREACQCGAAEGTFTADEFKDIAVIDQHERGGAAVLHSGDADGEVDGIAAVGTGLVCSDGHGCGAGGADRADHGHQKQNANQSCCQSFHIVTSHSLVSRYRGKNSGSSTCCSR